MRAIIFILSILSFDLFSQANAVKLKTNIERCRINGVYVEDCWITTDVNGKAKYISTNEARSILGISSLTNIFTGNQNGIANRSHDGNAFDMLFDDMGDFSLISSTVGKEILFERNTLGGLPINRFLIGDNDIQFNSDDGVNISTLTIGDEFIFANSNGEYVFDNFFNPIPYDPPNTNLLTLNAQGRLRQTDISTLLGSGSDSLIHITDSLCFIVMGDTTCAPLDSVRYYADEVCYWDSGDTTCIPFINTMVNIFNSNGALPEDRILDGNQYSLTTRFNQLLGGSGLQVISSTTSATGNSQKLFQSALTGINSTPGQSTYAAHISNTHSGTTSTNYGLYATASGGSSTNYAVYAQASGGVNYGLYATATNFGIYGFGGTRAITGSTVGGYGGWFETTDATNGFAMKATTAGLLGYGVWADASNSGTPLVSTLSTSSLNIPRRNGLFWNVSSGVPTNGFGGHFEFAAETSTTQNGTLGKLYWTWQDITHATRTSRFHLTGVSNAIERDIIYFEGDRRTRFNGRAQYQQGIAVASLNGAIALGFDGNVFEITGTNSITLISNVGWQNGSEITLAFTSTATLVDGTANSGTEIGIEMNDNTNFTATSGDLIKLVLCEVGGVQSWREPR